MMCLSCTQKRKSGYMIYLSCTQKCKNRYMIGLLKNLLCIQYLIERDTKAILIDAGRD